MQTTHVDLSAGTLTFMPMKAPHFTLQATLCHWLMCLSWVSLAAAVKPYIGEWYPAVKLIVSIAFLLGVSIPTIVDLPYHYKEAMIRRAKHEAHERGLTFVVEESGERTPSSKPKALKQGDLLLNIGLLGYIVFLAGFSIVLDRKTIPLSDSESIAAAILAAIPFALIAIGTYIRFRWRAPGDFFNF